MDEVVITGCILNFNEYDRQGEVISDCDIEFEQEIPMNHEWGDTVLSQLGFARLEKRPEGVWAKMTFRVEDPDFFTVVKKMKPCIGGTVYEKEELSVYGVEDGVRRKTNLNILKKIKISSIGICLANVDHGIKTLEEMENDTGTERKD